MSSHLEELVTFLHSPQPPARQLALENVVPFANNEHSYLFKADNYTPISDLKTLSKDKTERTAQLSFSCLINLCDDKDILDTLASDASYVRYVATCVVQPNQYNADLCCMLLTNLAKVGTMAEVFSWTVDTSAWDSQSNPFKSNKLIDCLVDCFVLGSDRKLNKFANFDFLAFFFADVSKFLQGRKYFTTRQEYDGLVPLSKLIPFTECESTFRRTGVASTIKNALFEIDSHERLVMENDDPDSVNLLPHILLPLAGPEDLREDEMFALPDELQLLPPDKKRDPDNNILKTYVESLLLLCTTRTLREYLREKGVYGLIRALHEATEDEDLQDVCDRLVQMLMRDEEPEQNRIQSAEDDEDDQVIEVL